MPEPSRKEVLLGSSPDHIERLYRKGYITAKNRNDLLHEKAGYELEKTLEDKGYLGAIFSQSVKNLQDGWDNLKESAIRDPSGKVGTELYYVGLAMWGQIQMLTSVINAVGEVTGKVAEQQSLRAGASPGLAKAIGFATDVGTGFVPVGMASKSFVKGVQKVTKKGAKAAAPSATGKPEVVQKVLAEGLEADGVKGAEKVLTSAAEGIDDTGAKLIRETEEAIAKATPPSVAEQFAADLKKFQDELAAITEPQAHEVTARLAQKLGLSLDDLKNVMPGQALNEREMYAYLKALEPRVKEWQGLAERVMSDGTEEAANVFARYTADLFTFAPKFRGAEVTAGRSVEILKEEPAMKALTDMAAAWDAEKMAKGDFIGSIQTMAEDVLAMTKEAPEKAQALIATGQGNWQRFKDKGWPMIREGYINLLLARPITGVRNFLGNSIAAANGVAERFAGGMFSADRGTGLVASEAFYMTKGMALALGDGIKAWGKAFQKIDASEVNKFDFVPGEIPGVLGRIIRSPGDNLRGMDNFFKTIFRRGSHYAQAIREGSQKGLDGDDLANFVARRINNPTERMIKEADDFALNQTFQNELGTVGKMAQRGLQAGPLALYFPFMKTPINLAKYAWNRTPGLQLLSKSLYDDIKAGGVKADMAIGRLTMSNLMGMFLFEMAKDGLITGSGPVDPALKRVWSVTNSPYSVKTKAGWIPIANAEPGSTVVGMAADFAQVLNQLDEPTAGQAAMALSFSVMNNLTDKTYWQTMSDLVDIASGVQRGHTPGKYPTDVLIGPAITVATGGPLAAGVARAIDPIKREVRTVMDSVLARVPGYSSTLPPDRDAYGDPILPPQAVGGSWLGIASPLTVKPLAEDRVKKEGNRLQIKAPDFPWTIGGKMRDDFDIRAPFPEDRLPAELTNQQRDRWQEIYRGMLRGKTLGIEGKLLDSDAYKNAPRALQREMFMGWMAQLRSTARDMLMVEDTALGKKVLENKAAHVLPMLTESQRAVAEPQLQRAITLFETLSQTERANLLRWGTIEETPED